MATTETFTCHLLKLYCYFTDENQDDEVFLEHNGKKIWPKGEKYKSLRVGEENIGIKIEGITPHEPFSIEVWDYDLLTPNDLLGKCTMIIDKQGGPFETDMVPETKKDVARYTIEWEAR